MVVQRFSACLFALRLRSVCTVTIVINHWRSAICPLLRLVSDLTVPRPSRPQVLLFHDFVFKVRSMAPDLVDLHGQIMCVRQAVRPARRRCPVARSA